MVFSSPLGASVHNTLDAGRRRPVFIRRILLCDLLLHRLPYPSDGNGPDKALSEKSDPGSPAKNADIKSDIGDYTTTKRGFQDALLCVQDKRMNNSQIYEGQEMPEIRSFNTMFYLTLKMKGSNDPSGAFLLLRQQREKRLESDGIGAEKPRVFQLYFFTAPFLIAGLSSAPSAIPQRSPHRSRCSFRRSVGPGSGWFSDSYPQSISEGKSLG